MKAPLQDLWLLSELLKGRWFLILLILKRMVWWPWKEEKEKEKEEKKVFQRLIDPCREFCVKGKSVDHYIYLDIIIIWSRLQKSVL